MDNFLKKVIEGRGDSDTHRYFSRFGKGKYNRRFLLSFDRGKKIKVRASFELANDFVHFVNELKDINFSGKILSKEKIPGKDGRKKAGVFLYEINEEKIDDLGNVYFKLLNVNDSEIILKIKGSLPKPGKNEEKIDNKFCAMDLDLKFWPVVKQAFFWDVPECKKAVIEHDLIITDIVLPKDESDQIKIRELSKRKGRIVRRINFDDKKINNEFEIEA